MDPDLWATTLLLEVRAGVHVGTRGRRVCEMIWCQVTVYSEHGNAVIAWAAPAEAGSSSVPAGRTAACRGNMDGLRPVAFGPDAALPTEPGPMAVEYRRRGR
ncbi:type I-E CRISPR-associated endoribonuclease Cas2e [Roseomonas sp. HJA6]|uniref:Type I-E CRISPR-associated endoribonuclease Cas2e n=1 Tax=Roseomonas alba TaxID=2846776 RepID=A0ABS7AAK7_9PROT|nr:type I-E CRISPR-associated endoribonuclease Cas2e [Neoroseomonas alba]MBW6399218.1 type I-E CRISPR-associated endoribonuclease Cas2e [Neoroseomonas alba]